MLYKTEVTLGQVCFRLKETQSTMVLLDALIVDYRGSTPNQQKQNEA